MNTTHPVTVEEACEFAGLQCQIQFGDHVEGKHKAGFLELKEFLPKGYTKIKGIDKRIFEVSESDPESEFCTQSMS